MPLDETRNPYYTSPSGKDFYFEFKDSERVGGRKIATHEMPLSDKVYVQEFGAKPDRYPMEIEFQGENRQRNADNFYEALKEPGPGTLHHQRYGDMQVVPVSDWTQKEDHVAGLNVIKINVTFQKYTPEITIPVGMLNKVEKIKNDVAANDKATATDGANKVVIKDDKELKSFKTGINGILASYEKSFSEAQGIVKSASDKMRAKIKEIRDTMDDLIAAPTNLFGALSDLAKIPALTLSNISGKIDAYKSQTLAAITTIPDTYAQAMLQTQALLMSLGGLSTATIYGGNETSDVPNTQEGDSAGIETKEEAEKIQSNIVQAIFTVTSEIERYEKNFGAIVPVDLIFSQLKIAYDAIESIKERSHSLKSRKIYITETEMTPVEIAALLYQDINQVDTIYKDNLLKIFEYSLIAKGRSIVYYS